MSITFHAEDFRAPSSFNRSTMNTKFRMKTGTNEQLHARSEKCEANEGESNLGRQPKPIRVVARIWVIKSVVRLMHCLMRLGETREPLFGLKCR
jgi:hypothetical protein